uniref:Secreted protein n=1 Tax=uncultured Planctomycetota bacterium TaxID=120965 RepID=H5SCS4_9BACT|nr:hypothetical protein HGMM_F11F07C32 [uncultured Planctomycetota bacterium]
MSSDFTCLVAFMVAVCFCLAGAEVTHSHATESKTVLGITHYRLLEGKYGAPKAWLTDD